MGPDGLMSASDLESGLIKVKALDGPVSSDQIQSILKREGINTDTGLDFESFLKVIYDIEVFFKTRIELIILQS